MNFGSDTYSASVALSAALFSIVFWAIFTWSFGIPTSESHALIAGLSGSALAINGGFSGINASEWVKAIYGLFTSCGLGFLGGFLICRLVLSVFKNIKRQKAEKFFKGAQIFASLFMSFMHGAQDGQKFIAVLLLTTSVQEENKGIFVLVKTSNPSSGEFQDQLINGTPLYELVGQKVAQWGEQVMEDGYSLVGAVVGATYPEMGKALRKIMPHTLILVPGYGAQGGQAKDLAPYFNEDGLGALISSSRGIIAAYKQEKYSKFGEEGFADAARQAVLDMKEDLKQVL